MEAICTVEEKTESGETVYPCARVIEFAKDGPCRLFCFGTAYICNDQGKTIEKVISGPLVI